MRKLLIAFLLTNLVFSFEVPFDPSTLSFSKANFGMGVWNLIYSGETNEFVERIRTSGVRLDEPDLVGQVGPITYGKMRFRKGQETFIFMPRAEEEYHKHGFFDKEKWYQVRTLWLKNSEDTWDYYFRMDEIE